tara:strand:+ start:1695 stop:2213 length:519 start_codon:yes stop_codon:yes gene_type:complete
MNTVYVNLSSIYSNNTLKNEELYLKGDSTLQFVLTGVNEEVNDVISLEINWGDSTIENYKKDLVYNYKEKTIFNELIYGKLGGSVMTNYNHTLTLNPSSNFTSLTAQLLIYYSNGVYADIYYPLTLVSESYYDNIKKFAINNTQMNSLSTSNTIANLQSKFNKQTYITYLQK